MYQISFQQKAGLSIQLKSLTTWNAIFHTCMRTRTQKTSSFSMFLQTVNTSPQVPITAMATSWTSIRRLTLQFNVTLELKETSLQENSRCTAKTRSLRVQFPRRSNTRRSVNQAAGHLSADHLVHRVKHLLWSLETVSTYTTVNQSHLFLNLIDSIKREIISYMLNLKIKSQRLDIHSLLNLLS